MLNSELINNILIQCSNLDNIILKNQAIKGFNSIVIHPKDAVRLIGHDPDSWTSDFTTYRGMKVFKSNQALEGFPTVVHSLL